MSSSLVVHSINRCNKKQCLFFNLTMRASFVNEIAEVEQGGPGRQVLNEPLRTRPNTQ